MTHPSSATACVFAAIQGHWLSATLRTLLELGVPEALADAPLDLEEVAAKTGVQSQGQQHLYKLLRTAAQYGLLDQLPDARCACSCRHFEITRPTALLPMKPQGS